MLRDLTLADALVVCGDMRPLDAACVRAVTGTEPGEWFAVDRWRTGGAAWVLDQGGQPWAIGGLSMPNEWTGVLWLVARPGLSGQSWRKTLRATRTVMERARGNGVHRIEARVLAGWSEASEFAARLGLVREGVLVAAGRGGESIEVWAKVAR